jgi:hypothetical protein
LCSRGNVKRLTALVEHRLKHFRTGVRFPSPPPIMNLMLHRKACDFENHRLFCLVLNKFITLLLVIIEQK